MKKSAILVSLLVVIMCSATAASAQPVYFYAGQKARLHNEISPVHAMRNDLILKMINRYSKNFGFAIIFTDEVLEKDKAERIFKDFSKNVTGKKLGRFIIFVGPDMHAIYKASSPTAERLAKKIIERSTYDEKVLAGPLVYNTVETMKHR